MIGTLLKITLGAAAVGVVLHYSGAVDMFRGSVDASYGTEAVANIGLLKQKLDEWHALDPSARPAPRDFADWQHMGGDFSKEQFAGKFYSDYLLDPRATFDSQTGRYVGYIKGIGRNDVPNVTIRFRENGKSDAPEYETKVRR